MTKLQLEIYIFIIRMLSAILAWSVTSNDGGFTFAAKFADEADVLINKINKEIK